MVSIYLAYPYPELTGASVFIADMTKLLVQESDFQHMLSVCGARTEG